MSPEAFNRLPPTRSLCWPHERIGHRVAAPAVRDRILMLTKRRMPANDVTIAVGDVCAGIGGFALGAPAHWRHAFFSEIDPFASAVLAQRFPDTPNLGDLGALDPADLPPLHVLCGGTPCQSFSSAGTQQGLRDPRGALTLKYLELVHGIQAKAPFRGTGVPVSIWENVVRVLQADEGSQFGTILAGLVGCDEPLRPTDLYGPRWPHSGLVAGPKRIVAWSVLDAADYGLPQQRRRLFVVSVRNGDGLCPCQILAQARARATHVTGGGSEQACAGSGSQDGAGSGGRVRVYQRNFARIGRGAPKSIARTVISQSGTSGRGDQAQLWLVERPDGTAYTRRMMPIEHERLQGLPDGYTQIAYAGCDPDDCSDALRFKAVGNSVAVPVVRAIAAATDAALVDIISQISEEASEDTGLPNSRWLMAAALPADEHVLPPGHANGGSDEHRWCALSGRCSVDQLPFAEGLELRDRQDVWLTQRPTIFRYYDGDNASIVKYKVANTNRNVNIFSKELKTSIEPCVARTSFSRRGAYEFRKNARHRTTRGDARPPPNLQNLCISEHRASTAA